MSRNNSRIYVYMHHGPVCCLQSKEKTMTQQHVLFQGGIGKLTEQP